MSDPTLFELTHSGTTGKSFSPHVWKTKVDLAILGVDYIPALRSFELIRGDLAEECGNDKVTVPTLKTPQGEYITDSWAIAEHLEKTYSTESKTLFPGGAAGKSLLKFLDSWLMNTFAIELRPIVGPVVYHNLDKPSQDLWLKNRFSSDQSKLDAFLAVPNDPARVTEQIDKARARLQTIEDLLAYQKSQDSGWLVGDKPSHADALVFGFYVFQVLSPEVKKDVWEHESLPLTRAWVERVKGLVPGESLP